MPTLPLTVCLIVRNEGDLLLRCLDSFASRVAEIVVVDTGSTDGTPDVARSAGAKVFDVPWQDDFSAARNAALALASAPWIMMLDADEWLPETTLAVLAQVLPQVPDDAVIFGTRHALDHGVSAFGPLLWPRAAGLRFRGRVHEILDFGTMPTVAEAPDVVVVNQRPGFSDLDRQQRLVTYERLLQLDLTETVWPETLLAAGDIALERRDTVTALDHYAKAIAHPDCTGQLRAVVDLQALMALRLAGAEAAADERLDAIVADWPDYLDARIEAAERSEAVGNPEGALWGWSVALRLVRFDRPQFLARRDARPGRLLEGVARALDRLGDVAGKAACQAALAVADGDAPLLDELDRRLRTDPVAAWQWFVLLFARPEVVSSSRLRRDDPADAALVYAEMAGFLQRRRSAGPDAERVLRQALNRSPDDPRLLAALAQVLAGYRHFPEARTLIDRACVLAPDHPGWRALQAQITGAGV
jgi:tetratricopeptide (TPR) repeat protein